ncbi:MAG: hypothetical protein NC921_01570 [Candidatus Omnitrophica bacterium]|nr:hypothetical protein [Candidatus Omnitrophota bacterium]MCM8810175.1 hypothetical protein [Candidatus Omnitrophota bacterium]
MKEIFNIIKRKILWVILSYVFVIILFWVIIFIPQKNQIIKNKIEKDLLEYNFLRIKNNPTFFESIGKTLKIAENLISNFEWLTYSDDPNLAFYEHIANLSNKTGVEIVSIKNTLDNSEIYYSWEVRLKGDYKNFIDFIYKIETDEKYLKIEEIEVLTGEEENEFFNLKISGIKKVK